MFSTFRKTLIYVVFGTPTLVPQLHRKWKTFKWILSAVLSHFPSRDKDPYFPIDEDNYFLVPRGERNSKSVLICRNIYKDVDQISVRLSPVADGRNICFYSYFPILRGWTKFLFLCPYRSCHIFLSGKVALSMKFEIKGRVSDISDVRRVFSPEDNTS